MEYKERRKQQSQRTEQVILSSALDLMREKGFDRVSVRDICAHAGITTGAFYHHFRSKDELLERGFAPLDQYMEQQLSGHEGDPPLQRLERILHSYINFMEGIGAALAARYYQQRLAKPSMRPLDPTRYTLRAMLSCFQQAQEEGQMTRSVTPEWAARFCFCHFRGVVIDWLLSGCQEPLQQQMEADYPGLARIFLP